MTQAEVELRPDQKDPAIKKDDHRRASIATYSGIEFFPLDARVEDVRIFDIAHATGMKCRYTGQCHQFYSVAQHAVFVSEIMEAMKCSIEEQFIGLMHDAQEAYLPDVASPIKGHLPGYREIELRLEAVIAQAFAFEFPHPKVVKVADAEAFKHEYRQIMPELMWWKGDPPKYKWAELEPWDPEFAREKFLQRFRRLNSNRPGYIADLGL